MNDRNSPSDSSAGSAEPQRDAVDALAAALRGLPDMQPPERVWAHVRQRTEKVRQRAGQAQQRANRRRAPLALAACLAIAALAAVIVVWFARTAADSGRPAAVQVAPAATTEFAALLARSRQLEAERRQAPFRLPPTRVERVLLDEIRNLDDSLNRRLPAAAEAHARQTLMHTRVDLMRSLVAIERSRRQALLRQTAI